MQNAGSLPETATRPKNMRVFNILKLPLVIGGRDPRHLVWRGNRVCPIPRALRDLLHPRHKAVGVDSGPQSAERHTGMHSLA